MQGRWRKRPSSLTSGSKEKLLSPALPWPPRTRQIQLQWPHPPRTLPLSHLHLLLPKSNLILYGWTSLPSWPAMASWLVMSVRSVSKTTCASIVVQETTSQTPVPRSRPQSLPRAMVFQQLLLRNPQKDREQPPGLCTDWGPCWTFLCSNEFNLTQCICSFQFSFTFCFSYLSLDPWSGSP